MGFPVKNEFVRSAISNSSSSKLCAGAGVGAGDAGGAREAGGLLGVEDSCGVQIAGVSIKHEDGGEKSESEDSKSESEGDVVLGLSVVGGRYRSSTSRSTSAMDWRGASLIQGPGFSI